MIKRSRIECKRVNVRYELYIDLYFGMNFIVDFMLLSLLKKFLLTDDSILRSFLGAFFGAFTACAMVCFPIFQGTVWGIFILYIGMNSGMLMIGLKIRTWKEYIRAFLFLYALSVIFGGVLSLFESYLESIFVFFVSCILGFFGADRIWDYFLALGKQQSIRYRIHLKYGEKTFDGIAFWDSGNLLMDPFSKKPVHIISENAANALGIKKEAYETFYKIPYQTVDHSRREMSVMQLDFMIISKGRERKMISQPMVGLSHRILAQGAFDVILNSKLVGGEEV